MGTRHQQKVINKKGEVKVSQYGQWDGYPSGQGTDILGYLRKGNLELYQQNLDNIHEITDEEAELVDNDPKWAENYPYLSRDCGAKIHQLIEDGKVPFVSHIEDSEAKEWCEGFYTIDFREGVFITEYYDNVVVFRLDSLPDDETYLSRFAGEE